MHQPKQTVLLTYGTFDLFHAGHVLLLERLKARCDRLIVGCSTDEFNRLKGKTSAMSFEDRRIVLESCRFVDLVIPEYMWEQKEIDIRMHHVDIFAMGDDWAGKFDHLQELCEVLYLPRTPDISTTEIKAKVSRFAA